MNSRERFRAAARREVLDRPPVWLMRQAGRYLPEYRALKERHSFLEMVRTPELAAEVTLQPMRRYPLDAAIIFSDILVVPEAMGQPYHFKEAGGIGMDFVLRTEADLGRLRVEGAVERLDYVPQALRRTRSLLGEERALLGFCGSPWTLATYMVEGGSPGEGIHIRGMLREEPARFARLLEGITRVCGDYLEAQIGAGVDAVQIFDSWGGLCPRELLEEGTLRWIRELVRRVGGRVPVIVFGRGLPDRLSDLAATGADVLSLDTGVDLAGAHAALDGRVAVQGNLDPQLMCGDEGPAVEAARRICASMRGRGGHIFNLGHGITPQARVETVGAVIAAVVQGT